MYTRIGAPLLKCTLTNFTSKRGLAGETYDEREGERSKRINHHIRLLSGKNSESPTHLRTFLGYKILPYSMKNSYYQILLEIEKKEVLLLSYQHAK